MTEKQTPHLKRTGHTKDARGKLVTLLDPYTLKLLRRSDVIPAESLRKIMDEFGTKTLGLARTALVGLVAVPLLLVLREVLQWSRGRPVGVFNIEMIGLYGAIPTWIIVWFWQKRSRVRRTCTIMLKNLRCPHCGYDIRGLPVDPQDGCTVCPECGCAWRLSSETR